MDEELWPKALPEHRAARMPAIQHGAESRLCVAESHSVAAGARSQRRAEVKRAAIARVGAGGLRVWKARVQARAVSAKEQPVKRGVLERPVLANIAEGNLQVPVGLLHADQPKRTLQEPGSRGGSLLPRSRESGLRRQFSRTEQANGHRPQRVRASQ